jgi:hypothetical protein
MLLLICFYCVFKIKGFYLSMPEWAVYMWTMYGLLQKSIQWCKMFRQHVSTHLFHLLRLASLANYRY